MTAKISRFVSRREALRLDQGAALRQMVLEFPGLPDMAAGQIVAYIDRHTAASKGWSFVMLSPDQNRIVVRWINAHAKRPRISGELWAEFFCRMRMDTGEIVATRQQLAEAAGATLQAVSSAMNELAAVGALIRHQEGREVRWFMNPTIGTCLTGKAREDAQRAAPQLSVVT
jgi:hypothetical protein